MIFQFSTLGAPRPRSLGGRLAGWLGWIMLALVGMVVLLSLLFWLLLMTLFNLGHSLVTGRPSAVGTLWRQYRQMARQRWPQSPSAAPEKPSSTPRADAVNPGPDSDVQDVRWREVPPAERDA